jgi:titin
MGKGALLVVAVVLGACVVLAAAAGAPASGTTFVVNSSGDTPDAHPGDGACADSGGHCSLHAAIMEANALPGTQTITFNLPTSTCGSTQCPQQIDESAYPGLPKITQPVVIDGSSQPDGPPVVYGAGCSYLDTITFTVHYCDGLFVDSGASESAIVGIEVEDFGGSGTGIVVNAPSVLLAGNLIGYDHVGIELRSGGSARVRGNWIGTFDGRTAAALVISTPTYDMATGISVLSSNNVIGGVSAGAGNLVSGNGVGIGLTGSASGNVVEGNLIGTTATGAAALPNRTYGVELDGVSANAIGPANVLSGNTQNGVRIQGSASSNTVSANYVGTDATGDFVLPNGQAGISIAHSKNNTIGGTTSADANVISGNSGAGVSISDADSTGDVVEGNLIGTDPSAGYAVPNLGGGVTAFDAPVQIGGTVAGAGNLISGNGSDAVTIASGRAQVLDNEIGTNEAGTAALANQGYGIFSQGSPTISGNLVSGNTSSGIWEDSGTGALIQGNTVGTNTTGSAAIANGGNGIQLSASGGDTISGNLVSGNTQNGIYLLAPVNGQAADVIQGNKIGTTAAGGKKVPNLVDGIRVDGVPNTQIGGTTIGARNIVSGNGHAGIEVDAPATGTTIQGNFVGTNAVGKGALGNTADGIDVFSGPTTIGGASTGARNIISGNFNGIDLQPGSSMTTVEGNFIGTNFSATAALGNTLEGVKIDHSTQNTIGGTTAATRNVISGNADGVRITADGIKTALQNVVEGNYLGTDRTGTVALGNSGMGIFVDNARGNSLGVPGDGNLISGNQDHGVELLDTNAVGNVVQGNDIGTNAADTATLPNAKGGVFIREAPGNTVGGSATGAGNLVAGNAGPGIDIDEATATGNHVDGNVVGGTAGFGNLNGVVLRAGASKNAVFSNTIAFNAGQGIFVGGSNLDRISVNSIFSNRGLGIDLAPIGVTPNDPAPDADTGANNLQNYPVLSSAKSGTGTVKIAGTLTSALNATYRLEFFDNAACDPSGHGEGASFLGATNVTTNGSGAASFSITLGKSVTAGDAITATAIDSTGNTSEFSQCVAASAAPRGSR